MSRSRILFGACLVLAWLILVPREAPAKVIVAKDGNCAFKITFQLQFHGAGATEAFAKKVKDEIESCWKGFKVGCCPVTVTVVTKVGGAVTAGFDQINVADDSQGGVDDHVSTTTTGSVNDGDTKGDWDNNEPANTYAHEAGHIAGLPDTYKTEGAMKTVQGKNVDCRKTKPCRGHDMDKMATLGAGAMIEQAAIEKLIKDAGLSCPVECWPANVPGLTGSPENGKSNPPGPQKRPSEGPSKIDFILDPEMSSFVFQQPRAMGGNLVTVRRVQGTFSIQTDIIPPFSLNPTLDLRMAGFVFTDLHFDIPSFDWRPGLPTGPNQLMLANLGPSAPSLGQIDDRTGQFTGILQAFLTNNLPQSPYSLICGVTGKLDYATGQIGLMLGLSPIISQPNAATCSISPATATNPVRTNHTVTVTVTQAGSPSDGVSVNFNVTGANSASGVVITKSNGQATFSYTGTSIGTDTITAGGTVGGLPFQCTAQKTWVPCTTMCDINPRSIDFGDVCPGASTTRGFMINNSGSQPLTVSAFNSTNPRVTLVSPALPAMVPPGGGVPVTVRLTCSSPGAQSGTLSFTTSIGCGPVNCGTVAVSGFCVQISCSVPMQPVDFSQALLGGTVDRTFNVNNNGNRPVTITAINSNNQAFSVVSPTLPVTVSPIGSVPVMVRMRCMNPGPQTGMLSFNTSSLCGAIPCGTVNLTGFCVVTNTGPATPPGRRTHPQDDPPR